MSEKLTYHWEGDYLVPDLVAPGSPQRARKDPVALSDLIQILSERKGWKAPTVKTLVRNLRIKDAVRLTTRGHYAAVVTEQTFNTQSTHSFIGKVFEGSAKKLVASLISDGQLTQKDLAELAAQLYGDNVHE